MSNVPWAIPQHWRWARVTDIGSVLSGGTPQTKNAEFWGGEISWITPKDLSGYREKHISRGAKTITEAGLAHSSAKLIPAGSILFSSRAPIGYVAISKVPLATNQGFKNLIPNADYSAEYLFWYFKSAKRLAEKRASGTTFKEISGKGFGALPVPLCPLPEQRRIVEKIEALFSELDHGFKTLETARKQLKVYRQTVLKHAFEGKLTERWRANNLDKAGTADSLLRGVAHEREERYERSIADWEKAVEGWIAGGRNGKKPPRPRKPSDTSPHLPAASIPENWRHMALGNLNIGVSDGPFGSNLKSQDYVGSGVRVIRLENIGWLEFKDDKRSFITEEKYQTIAKHTVSSGDLIFASFIADGTRIVELPEKIKRAVNKADCFCVRVFGETINNKYLAIWLATNDVYRQLEAEIHGATRPRINTTQLRQVVVPVCSPAEQNQVVQEIESRLSVVDDLEKTIDDNLKKSEALRQSILKKAFAGALVEPEETFSEDVVLHAQLFVIGLYLHTQYVRQRHTFHRTKAEKMVHLAEYGLGLDVRRNPYQAPRGPYDGEHLDAAEECAQQMGWLKIKLNTKDKNWVDYLKGPSFEQGLEAARESLGEQFEAAAGLFKLLEPMNYEAAEITATVYAAWNNRLLAGEIDPSDATIVRQAREEWRFEKDRYTPEQFQAQIDWLREHGLVPVATGKVVRHRPVHPGQKELPLETGTD